MSKQSKPSLQVCQLCALDGEVVLEADGPDVWRFVCTGPHHDEPYRWYPTSEMAPVSGRSGVGEELGIYDDLLLCAYPEQWSEYGVVEYRYAGVNASGYAELIRRYGHRSLQPAAYSASAFIGRALGQLEREGLLALRWLPATGYWNYNGTISGWAVPGTPIEAPTISWAAFAPTVGGDPAAWPWAAGSNAP